MKLSVKNNPNEYYYQDLDNLVAEITNRSKSILYLQNENSIRTKPETAEYIVMVNLVGALKDVQSYLSQVRSACKPSTRIVVTYYNYLWEPILKSVEALGIKEKQNQQNWLTIDDIENLLLLTGFSAIKKGQRLLLPVYIPLVSFLVNKYIAKLPIINKLCLTNYIIARPIPINKEENYSVSVIVPARNEAGNIGNLINRLPHLGKSMEIIFVEGHSKDKTWEEILEIKNKHKHLNISAYKQKGIGKADAVRLGVKKANGDIIIILDADLSVPPEDIPKFYQALSFGIGEFINGSRLVYPLEKQSMRFLNILGNKAFSLLFSWILEQRFTDTLCGTKAFFRKDYEKIQKLREYFGDFDPFGDYELIFGAVKLNLKVVEIPIHYKARVYGTSNISRFVHGWLLLKMCFFAFRKFKFY